MKSYSVSEAFEILQDYKITSHEESVRRWLRNGTIKGTPPLTRKEGWQIKERDLFAFIDSRMPERDILNATNDVNEKKREQIRAEMWWELANKNIFEGFLEPKKKQVQACIKHKGYSQDFETYIWQQISGHTRGYATPRIPYLLDAFLFDGTRLKMDNDYASVEERILYALIEVLRRKRTKKKN